MARAGAWDETVLWKVEKMKQKTEFVLSTFGIPETESVIQDYRCKIKKTKGSFSGRIWLTQNYILFQSASGEVTEAIPCYRIQNVTRTRNAIGLPNGIDIETESGRYSFGGFMHREEAFFLIQHLFEYQPTYASLNDAAVEVQESQEDDSISAAAEFGLNVMESRLEDDELDGRWSGFVDSTKTATVKDYHKVDTDITKKALQTANEIREITTFTLQEMERQDEAMDRIQLNVDETKNNIDKSDRVIDGISNWAGQVKNAVTPDLYKGGVGQGWVAPDRSINVKDAESFVDVPILVKHSNDAFEPAVLRFGDKRFFCLRTEDGKKIKEYDYSYDQVGAVVLRARHQHLDIRFHDGTERFRCCTSFVQALTNEIILRTRATQVSVVFEPGTKQFQYGSLELRSQSMRGSRDAHSSLMATGGFILPSKINQTAVIDRAPEEVKQALDEQDSDIRDLTKVVADLQNISVAMSEDLDAANERLDDLNNSVDKSNKKLHKDNYRVKRMN